MIKSLKAKLIDYLVSNPKTLEQIYSKFKGIKPTTIRGRLNENIDRHFKRIGRGIYIATKDGTSALLIEGDAYDVMQQMEDNSIDLIITDSPYSILNKQLATGTTRKLSGKWSFKTQDLNEAYYLELIRILKPGGHYFTFLPSDTKDTNAYNLRQIDAAQNAGFTFNKKFIWDKVSIGMGYHGRSRYEQIIFFSKGTRRMPSDLSIPDLLSHKRIPPKQRIHETQKPTELIIDLIHFSTEPGEWVLDPFAGSFSTIEAALKTRRHSIGIELNRKYIQEAQKRLQARVLITRHDGIRQHYHITSQVKS